MTQQAIREKYERRVSGQKSRLERLLAQNDPDPMAVQSAELALSQVEDERDAALEVAGRVEREPPNPNAAQPVMINTSPVAPPPPPAFSASAALATHVARFERLVEQRREELLEGEQELDAAKRERVKHPEAPETRDRLRAALASLTERGLDLEAAEGALAKARDDAKANAPNLAKADRLLAASSVDQFLAELAPLEAEAQELGRRLGELSRRALDVVQRRNVAAEQAAMLVKSCGLPVPRLPDVGRSEARRVLGLAYRRGIDSAGMAHERQWWWT